MQLQLQVEAEEIRIRYFTRKKKERDLIETFRITRGIYNYGRHISIFLFVLGIYCQDKFQKLSLLSVDFLLNLELIT